jgi:uncharacterized protein YktB (UPF0637 family)
MENKLELNQRNCVFTYYYHKGFLTKHSVYLPMHFIMLTYAYPFIIKFQSFSLIWMNVRRNKEMNFEGFTEEDFETFTINGLENRMEAIRENIQPKFNELGQALTDDLSIILQNEMHLHIAKHLRRTINPPKDTWLAIAANKRGYKQHPHFQVGLFDDHLFIWLAFIYELPNKENIAKNFLNNINMITNGVPGNYYVSLDHTKKDAKPLNEIDLKASLERFRDVKKAEFLIGRQVKANNPLVHDGENLYKYIQETFKTLVPLYKISI